MNFRRICSVIAAMVFLAVPAGPAFADAVRVTVNTTSISDTQIAMRANLLRLERRGANNSDRQKLATNELIDEALELQEADRLGISVSDSDIDDGLLNVARNLKVSVSNLRKILSGNGVNVQTLRDRLKAAIAWQRVTESMVMPQVQISELELDKKAKEKLTATESYDYLLKEVLFIIPRNSGASASRRTAQANQYRRSFKGCDGAVDLSLSYTDAAVLDIGRRNATQLPDPIAKELAQLPVGGITKPRVTDKGVSMLAVCSKEAAQDLTFIKSQLRRKEGTEKLKSKADDYLQRLKDQAAITYR